MGRDFMSAPGTLRTCATLSCVLTHTDSCVVAIASSCDVERAFSRGGLTVSKYRHALSDESTRAATLLNSWSKIPGLIPDAEIIQTFKDKSRRLGKKKQGSTETATDDGMDIDESATGSIDLSD